MKLCALMILAFQFSNPEAVRTWLARSIVAEQGERAHVDARIIPHVLYSNWKRRGTRGFVAYIRQYSRPMSPERGARVPRAAALQRRPWGSIHRSVRDVVTRWMRGELRNPCPAATDWDMPSAQAPKTMRRVCRGLPTKNYFYRYSKRRAP